MIEEIKLRVAIWFLYAVGFIVRKFTRDPLADFFDEMERSGRIKIDDNPTVSNSRIFLIVALLACSGALAVIAAWFRDMDYLYSCSPFLVGAYFATLPNKRIK